MLNMKTTPQIIIKKKSLFLSFTVGTITIIEMLHDNLSSVGLILSLQNPQCLLHILAELHYGLRKMQQANCMAEVVGSLSMPL